MVCATYNGKDYYAKFTLKKLINAVKYSLMVTPAAIGYNTSTQEYSLDSQITVEVYKHYVGQNGYTYEKVSSLSYSTNLGGMYISVAADSASAQRVTTYNNGYTFSVDPTKSKYTISLYRRTVTFDGGGIGGSISGGSGTSTSVTELLDVETVPILKSANGAPGAQGAQGLTGKNALPLRIRKWSDVDKTATGATPLSGDDKIFSGWEEGAKYRDVIMLTYADYAGRPTDVYPFIEDDEYMPVLLVINYSNNKTSGYDGTELVRPQDSLSNYTLTIPQSQAQSGTLPMWSVFMNFGAIYASMLVATEGYIEDLTVDDLLANNATIANNFTAQHINATGGSIGDLVIDNGGFGGEFTGEANVSGVIYDLKNEVNIDENKIEFGSEAVGRSSGNVMSSGTLTIGMEASNASGGFVEIDCTKRDNLVGAVPKFDCGLKITAENAANALEVVGNTFVDGALAGRKKIYSSYVLLDSYKSGTISLSYKDSGSFIYVDSNTTPSISLNANTVTSPGFNFKLLVNASSGGSVTIDCSAIRAHWYKCGFSDGMSDYITSSTGNITISNTAGLYEVIYLGEETYQQSVNNYSGTYNLFVICQLS